MNEWIGGWVELLCKNPISDAVDLAEHVRKVRVQPISGQPEHALLVWRMSSEYMWKIFRRAANQKREESWAGFGARRRELIGA